MYYIGTEETDNHDHIGTEETESKYPHRPVNNSDECPFWMTLILPAIMVILLASLIYFNR